MSATSRAGIGGSGARGLVARAFRSAPAAGFAGVLERIAAPPQESFAVLTYHRVDEPSARPWLNPSLVSATPTAFEEQMTALIRRHNAIGLPELLTAHRTARRPLPPRAVLVTFDDGYRDFLEHAWPVLGRLGIPATMFIPTSYPDSGQAFWWDRLWRAVATAPEGTVDTPAGSLELTDEASRRTATRTLVDHHKRMGHAAAMRSVDELVARLGVKGRRRGGRRPDDPDLLSWDEIKRLAATGLHVAPHSRAHPLLTRLEPDALDAELVGSRQDLHAHLGELACGTAFAYPAGAHDAAARDALVRTGYELGFTTERGINQVGASDPLRLRRINVGMRAGSELLRAQLAIFTLRYRARGI